MGANESNGINEIHNQEAYEGIKQVMLQEGVIPREMIRYSEEVKEKKRLEELKNKWGFVSSHTGTAKNIIESIDRQYPTLKPIITPIKIIIKRVDGMFEIIDLILEYQLNGEEGVLIKIGEEIIASIVFSAGAVISSIIATRVALVLSAIDKDFGIVVGFFVFSNGVIVSDWLANKSKKLVHFAYEHIYLPTKNTWKDLKNGFDYLLSGDWYKE
ncbi:hypothetical protein, partial [Helicobacter sp. MIT 14-3879]|uniref:hypothetical protein n=1 Tax=Helicobacter sp. MIT 14-3879 TaxID=2040649 RepID=UPI000E37EADB